MKLYRNETINFLLMWEEDLKVMIVRGDPQKIAHALWSDRLEDLSPLMLKLIKQQLLGMRPKRKAL